jgi:DNA-binding LacI/PurR family transcriptional regulator
MTGQRRGASGRVKIGDVAREAGVSAQTVSNVINQREGFSEQTRERVLKAIELTGYRPNRAARQLRTGRPTIGLHLPGRHLSVKNTFAVAFLRQVIEAADRLNQQLVILTQELDDSLVESALVSSGLDGVVLFIVDPADPRPGVLARAGIPFALFGRTGPDDPQSWLDIDNAGAMADVVDHLVERGKRTFAYVGYDEPEYWNSDRLTGTLERLREHGLAIPRRRILEGSLESIGGMLPPLFEGTPSDAIICASDSLAVIVHNAATRAGLRPGIDIAITGFDAIPLCIEPDPPLTSVELPIAAAAEGVIRLLIDQIEGRPPPEHGQILPTRLVIGGSA